MPLNALDRSARAHNPKVGGSNPPPATGEVFTFDLHESSRLV
jgi:hypothetical protein